MSHQATNWAIEQRTGGPSPKATLWSIANYANENWCSWPSQKTISDESEQSLDTVQRRVRDLEEVGLVRRIPLHYAGRKTVDFFILKPSPFFQATLDEIEPLLPRGYCVAPQFAAADCGSADSENPGVPSPDAAANAAANAAAMVRQPMNLGTKEPLGGGVARATQDAIGLSMKIAEIAGHDPDFLPPNWMSDGPAMRVQMMLDQGWKPQMMLETARAVMGAKRDGPPGTIRYFEKPFAKAHSRQSLPSPLPQSSSTEVQHAQAADHRANSWQSRRDRKHEALAELRAHNERLRQQRGDASG